MEGGRSGQGRGGAQHRGSGCAGVCSTSVNRSLASQAGCPTAPQSGDRQATVFLGY